MSVVNEALEYVRVNRSKLLKFLAVTGGSVVMGQLLFASMLYILDWPYVRANITSVVLMVTPNYLASRYWVWEKRSKNSLRTEVLPFWTMAFIGFVFSTIAVWFVESQGWSRLAALVANFGAFGVVWVFKFFVLERYLFGPAPRSAHETDGVAADVSR